MTPASTTRWPTDFTLDEQIAAITTAAEGAIKAEQQDHARALLAATLTLAKQRTPAEREAFERRLLTRVT